MKLSPHHRCLSVLVAFAALLPGIGCSNDAPTPRVASQELVAPAAWQQDIAYEKIDPEFGIESLYLAVDSSTIAQAHTHGVLIHELDPMTNEYVMSQDIKIPDTREMRIEDDHIFVHTSSINGNSLEIWKREVTGWTRSASITVPVPILSDEFAVCGDLLVVRSQNGAGDTVLALHNKNQGGTDNWGLTKEIEPIEPLIASSTFGRRLACDSDRILAYQRRTVGSGSSTLTVGLFEKDAGGIDQWGESAIIQAPDPLLVPFFASSLAIDANRIAIGIKSASTAPYSNGAVALYEFDQSDGSWGHIQTVAPNDNQTQAGFGHRVELDGPWLFALAPDANSTGAIYAYKDNGSAQNPFVFRKLITPSDEARGGDFSEHMSMSGDTLVVSREQYQAKYNHLRAIDAYVYKQNEGGFDFWGEAHTIDPPLFPQVGSFLARSSNYLITGPSTGFELFLYERDADPSARQPWAFSQRIVPPPEHERAIFTTINQVDKVNPIITDTHLFVPIYDNYPINQDVASVLVYQKSMSAGWEFVQQIQRPISRIQFASSIAAYGSLLAIGHSGDKKVYLYELASDGTWTLEETVLDPSVGFGNSISISDNYLAASSHTRTSGGNLGTVRVHERDPTSGDYSYLTTIGNPNSGSALFGRPLKVHSDMIAVTNRFKESSGLTVGAVLLYQRSVSTPNTFDLIKTIEPPDSTEYKYFGASIDLNDDWLIVGAYNDAEGNSGAGAAYLYQRDVGGANAWGYVRKLVVPNAAMGANFGWSVLLDNEHVIVSASGENPEVPGSGTVYFVAPDNCGDNVLDSGEGCDDGNRVGGDGCSASCLLELNEPCTSSEACDSNLCNVTCVEPNVCGNGVIEMFEVCDSTPGCAQTCLLEDGEACDMVTAPLSAASACESGVCDASEMPARCEPVDTCGNGQLEDAEACDDGNDTSGDGCGHTCLLEEGAPCSSPQACASNECVDGACTQPAAVCGNGALEESEACDDGNTTPGDGCDALCAIEPEPEPEPEPAILELLVTSPMMGETFQTNEVVVSGQVNEDARIAVSISDVVLYSRDETPGVNAFTTTLTLEEGSHDIVILATRGMDTRKVTRSVVIDIPTDPTVDVDPEQTIQPGQTITGTGKPGQTIAVTANGQDVCTVSVDDAGTWACKLPEGLEPGVIDIKVVDANTGETLAESSITVQDNASPTEEENPTTPTTPRGPDEFDGCAQSGSSSPTNPSLGWFAILLVGLLRLRRSKTHPS